MNYHWYLEGCKENSIEGISFTNFNQKTYVWYLEGVFSLTWSCQDGCNYKHVSLTYGFGWSMFFFTIWHWRFSLLQSDLIEKILGSPPAHHFCHQLLFHHAHPVAKQEVCRTKNFDQGRLRRNPPWSEQCEITVFWLNLWGHINYMTRSHKPFKTP